MKFATVLSNLLGLLLFVAQEAQANSANSVTVTIAQSGSETFISWSGQFAYLPQASPDYSGSDALRMGFNSYFFVAFTGTSFDSFSGFTIVNTIDLPVLEPTGEEIVGTPSVFGLSHFSTSNPSVFVPTGYTPGTTLAGCIKAPNFDFTAFPTYTDRLIAEWTNGGNPTQQVLLTVDKTGTLPLCNGVGFSGGSGGDPHITTWGNQKYDFHGHCDLVLLKNQAFRNGKGMAVHIRSSPFKTIYSYISAVAIRIGKDVLEIGGKGTLYLNNKKMETEQFNSFAGLPVEVKKVGKTGLEYSIWVSETSHFTVREQRGWLRFTMKNGQAEDFMNSTGLMGSYNGGIWYGRDGVTVFQTENDFGMEWQVQQEDGLLFTTPSPFPDKCEIITPDTTSRRLSESTVSHEDAAQACMKWGSEVGYESCMFDVMVSDDLEMADAGPY